MRLARRIARWTKRALLGLVLLAALGLCGAFVFARSRLPRESGEARLPGLSRPVTIRRDRLGVPHIDAATELDAWAAVGFVHAQDRFFQMDLARRAVSGRLSEIVGAAALPLDRENLTLQMARTARQQLAALPASSRAILHAYARGVNAGLADTGRPLECILLGYRPARWKPLDTLLVLKYMEDLLAPDGGERRRATMAERVGPEVAAFLYDFQGMRGATILPAGTESRGPSPSPSAPQGFAGSARPEPELTRGSNSWVVSGDRTRSGRPLLANDTHLARGVPAIWYQAHVRFPGVDVVGMTIAGEPFPIIGHNGRVAWGITTLMADQVDFVRLELDPSDPERYRTSTGWERFEQRQETIPILGATTEALKVRWSRFGPVVERHGSQALARQWTVYFASRTIVAARAIVGARNVPELLAATRDFTSPGSNLVAADVTGHIGWAAAGAIPARPQGDGTYPTDGSRPDAAWTGLVAPEEAPTLLDPTQGFIVTANNRIGTGPAAMRIARRWAQPFRANRIVELLQARQHHDVGSMEHIQGDVVSLAARVLMRALPAPTAGDPAVTRAYRALRAWNSGFRRGVPPSLFTLFERELRRAVFEDDAGAFWVDALPGLLKVTGAVPFEEVPPAMAARDWFDDRRTRAHETAADMVARALAAALKQLRARFGGDPSDQAWERVHTLRFTHPLGKIPALARIFDVGPLPIQGCATTICSTAGDPDDPFEVTQIPVFRMVVDLGDLRRSRTVNSVGQSGHRLSPHYDDQVERWARVESYPMLYARADVAEGTKATLVLRAR